MFDVPQEQWNRIFGRKMVLDVDSVQMGTSKFKVAGRKVEIKVFDNVTPLSGNIFWHKDIEGRNWWLYDQDDDFYHFGHIKEPDTGSVPARMKLIPTEEDNSVRMALVRAVEHYAWMFTDPVGVQQSDGAMAVKIPTRVSDSIKGG